MKAGHRYDSWLTEKVDKAMSAITRNSTRLMEHIRDNPAKDVYEDEFFSIRYFQKGTAHLTFKRLDLIERMNDIIAKHYPGMLAAR